MKDVDLPVESGFDPGNDNEVRQQLAAIVNSSDDAIIGEGLDGTITSWNQGAERIFGYSKAEAIGQNVSMLSVPGDELDVTSILERVLRGERVDHYETVRRRKDGSRVDISLTLSPICSSTGSIIGLSKVARDISARRETEQTRALLASIVESSDDVIISKTLDGIVTSWNKSAERVFGYKAEEMVGNPISRIACPGREDDLTNIIQKIRRGERVDHYETMRRCKDGREILMSLTVSPVRDGSGRIIGASKVARDITRQRQTEAKLQNADKLAMAGRMAASIAHEINNPLEAITNLLYLIDNENLSEENKEYLRMAQHELSRVSHIASQTLGFFRSNAEPLDLDVSEVAEDALALQRGRFITGNIEVERVFAPVPKVRFNRGELRQVLANLLANAADAMPSGGRLQVRVHPAVDRVTNAQGVRILIADQGVGMSAETKKRLFEEFYTTKEATGTGLGLWVSREIIKKHGGRISFRSNQSERHSGTVFALFLSLEGRSIS